MNEPMVDTLLAKQDPRSTAEATAFRASRLVPLPWGIVALWVLASTGLTGCALNKAKVNDNVVSARQISLQAIDAKQRGRLQEAQSLFGRATELCPLDETIRSHYAETLWEAGHTDAAVSHMEEAARLSGGKIELSVRLGEMYLAQGDLNRAGTQADIAIRGNRQLASAWALRGNVLRAQGRDVESLASYDRALSSQAHYPSVQLAVAEIYRHQGRPSRALATLRTLADEYPPDEIPQQVLLLEGIALKQLRRYQAATDLLARAAAQGQPDQELLLHLAESQYMAGDPVNARLTVQSALTRSTPSESGHAITADLISLQRRLTNTSRL